MALRMPRIAHLAAGILTVGIALCSSLALAYAPDLSDTLHRRADGSWDATRDYAYSYDGAGNVVLAGRVDATGQGRAAFEANALNFHVVRRWNAVDLVGVALPSARVMVNGRLAPRDGARFVFPLPLTDGTPAHLTNLTVTAALDDGNAEQYATRTVTLRIPACPEPIDVALAGATVGDSLAEYLFDARNRLRRVTDKVGAPPLAQRVDDRETVGREQGGRTVEVGGGRGIDVRQGVRMADGQVLGPRQGVVGEQPDGRDVTERA